MLVTRIADLMVNIVALSIMVLNSYVIRRKDSLNYNTSTMTFKTFYIAPIKGYQYISKMLPASCRYYPTCSEYASWQFQFNRADKALLASSARILRCNQFFEGGIDYPLVDFSPQKTSCVHTFNADYGKIDIAYWLVPNNKNKYYVVKDFDATKRST